MISSFGVSKCGPIAQPSWVGCTMLVRAISACLLMAVKAERFAIGGCITAAAAYCRAVMRLPCATFALCMILKHKFFAATLTLAVGVVKDFALCFVRKSHCRLLSQRVCNGLPFRSDCSGQALLCSFRYFIGTQCANDIKPDFCAYL